MLLMASGSDMASTSSPHETKPIVDPSDPLGEANFVPRYLVCVNPLCRRKWKQLTPKSIPMFCPSCKKAAELALRDKWGVTDDTLYYNLLKYWHSIYKDIENSLGFPKCRDLNLPKDPEEVTILNVMDYYQKAFPEGPHPEDVRNWSSMGQRKKQMTGTIIRQCGTLLWELTVLEDLQHQHGSRVPPSQRHHDMVGHRFYLIDWRGSLKIGDHLQFVAFPNPSVEERGQLPHVLKILDDRVNPPHHPSEKTKDEVTNNADRQPAGKGKGTYSRTPNNAYYGRQQQQQPYNGQYHQDRSQARYPQLQQQQQTARPSSPLQRAGANSNQQSYGTGLWQPAGQFSSRPSADSPQRAGQDVRERCSPPTGTERPPQSGNASSPHESRRPSDNASPIQEKKFSPEVGSLVDSAVAPPPGFEDLADDTHLALGQLAQLLSAAANKEVPPTPQAPTLEPRVPESSQPSPSPAVPAAKRPDWIPDTPASPLYLHRDMNFGQTPNPLVQFLQMQAAAGAAGQIPPGARVAGAPYGAAGSAPTMATPFMPMGSQSAASVGLDGELAGLAAWGASWPSTMPSSINKRQSNSQPPTPIQEETVNEYGEVCAATATTAAPSQGQHQQGANTATAAILIHRIVHIFANRLLLLLLMSSMYPNRSVSGSQGRVLLVWARPDPGQDQDPPRAVGAPSRALSREEARVESGDPMPPPQSRPLSSLPEHRPPTSGDDLEVVTVMWCAAVAIAVRRTRTTTVTEVAPIVADMALGNPEAPRHRERIRITQRTGKGGELEEMIIVQGTVMREPTVVRPGVAPTTVVVLLEINPMAVPHCTMSTAAALIEAAPPGLAAKLMNGSPTPMMQHDTLSTPEAKEMPQPPPSTRRSKAQVEFGKPIRPDPRDNAQKGNVLVLACDCPRKYVPDPGPHPLSDPAWLPTIQWGQATFEERILLRREVAPRAVANARGQSIASPTVCYPTVEDSSWHETWPSDVDCRIVCVLRLPDLVTSDDTFLRAVRGAIPHNLRARDGLQKAVVIKASGLGGSVVQARCGYLAFRTRRDAHECWSLRHLKLYGYVCPLIADPTAFRTLCQIALVLKLYEGNSIGATTSGLTTRPHVLESSSQSAAAPAPSSQPGITGTKFGGGLSSRKPLPSAVRGADSNGGASSATSRGRFILRGLKASLERLKGPPVEACGNFTASAVRYSRLDQRDGAVIGRTEYVRAETSSDGQSQKLHIGLTKDRSVVVLETNDDNKLADWRPEWVFRDWAWGCRPMSVTQAEKKSADEEIDPAELSDYSTYSLPDMSVFKPIRPVVAAQPIGGGSPQSKARSTGTSRKSKKSKKKEKKKRRTSHDLTTKLTGTEVKAAADGAAVKTEVQAGGR
ncbi:hypothetical protein FOL47_007921 [Perkinsus chesapeaki]|uniref:Uncharacterized protein n=1 Tax=Perkinsus chesapeaki TaxID=330153 RepID=A0A7J6MUW6_PERCH|nr:hypothetical protein FOL47_007921 [Perkinsus chesapeaki]